MSVPARPELGWRRDRRPGGRRAGRSDQHRRRVREENDGPEVFLDRGGRRARPRGTVRRSLRVDDRRLGGHQPGLNLAPPEADFSEGRGVPAVGRSRTSGDDGRFSDGLCNACGLAQDVRFSSRSRLWLCESVPGFRRDWIGWAHGRLPQGARREAPHVRSSTTLAEDDPGRFSGSCRGMNLSSEVRVGAGEPWDRRARRLEASRVSRRHPPGGVEAAPGQRFWA